MIEYLKRLVETKDWEQVLAYAEQFTNDANRNLEELVTAYHATLRARIATGDYAGALVAGALVTKLAEERGDWDTYGFACTDIGVSHFMLKEYDAAAKRFKDYLSNVDRYREALPYQVQVWFNLGCVYRATQKGAEAIAALSEGLKHAHRFGDSESMHGIRVTLVDAKLKAGETDQVPKLLAQTARYLRSIDANKEQRLYYTAYRVEFALLTRRFRRAHLLATRGLLLAAGTPRWQYDFHLLLAKISRGLQRFDAAIQHALAARTCAVVCNRSDLEAEASGVLQMLLDHNEARMP